MKTLVPPPLHKIPIEQLYGELQLFFHYFSPPLIGYPWVSQSKLRLMKCLRLLILWKKKPNNIDIDADFEKKKHIFYLLLIFENTIVWFGKIDVGLEIPLPEY